MIRDLPYRFLLIPAFVAAAFAQPGFFVAATVSSAASPEVGVSPGSLVAIHLFGVPSPAFPEAEKIQITFEPEGTGQTIAAGSIIPVTPTELRTVMPRDMHPGDVVVKVLNDGTPFVSARASVAAAAPGLYTINSYGDGPALAQIYPAGTVSLNSLTRPALPGQDVTLWLTGLGNQLDDVSVDVAGSPVQATYAGHHAIPGLDQINIRLAADSVLGCYVPVAVRVGQTASNVGTLAINSTPGACAHPLGIPRSDLVTLDAGGRILVGEISLSGVLRSASAGSDPDWSGSARAKFFLHDATDLFRLAQIQEPFSENASCRMLSGVPTPDATIVQPADAGPVLTLSGPGGEQLPLEQTLFYYTGQPPAGRASFFTPGVWQLSAPGGNDLAAFREAFTLPPPIRWTNRDELATVPRDRDVAVRWDPAGYGSGQMMTVTLARPPGGIQCRTYARQGQLSLPQAMLQHVEPTPMQGGHLTLEVRPQPGARELFSLMRAWGESIQAVVDYRFSEVRDVAIQ